MEYYSVHQPDSPRNHHPHHGPDSWDDERPPTYNPEDYAAHLTRFNSFIYKNHVMNIILDLLMPMVGLEVTVDLVILSLMCSPMRWA